MENTKQQLQTAIITLAVIATFTFCKQMHKHHFNMIHQQQLEIELYTIDDTDIITRGVLDTGGNNG